MDKQISVYIASPYSLPKGQQEINVLKSFDIYDKLSTLGFIPFAPLTSHYIHCHFPRDYKNWLEIDIYWLKKCDCVLRISGESSGADMEVSIAKEHNKPVFYNIEELKKHYGLT